MRSLSLLVLLHFAVVVCTAVTPEQMKELLATGAPQRLKSFTHLYLTDDLSYENLWSRPRQDWGRFQAWTIVQLNDHEVAIKSNRGYYLSHGRSDWAKQAQVASEWEMLTPVKNEDGSWSFKSRWNKWLNGCGYQEGQLYFIPELSKCEHWWLETYIPPANPLMDELLADGGRRRFKSHNDSSLTDDGRGFLDANPWLVMSDQPRGEAQLWTIIQMSENEVVIESSIRYYVSQGRHDDALQEPVPGVREMLTPVKNADGSWSFKSRENKWLSAAKAYPLFVPENGIWEQWRLELS